MQTNPDKVDLKKRIAIEIDVKPKSLFQEKMASIKEMSKQKETDDDLKEDGSNTKPKTLFE